MPRRSKRRPFPIVKKSLQYRFLATILIYCFAIVMGCGAVLFVPDIVELHQDGLSIEMQRCIADRVLSRHPIIWVFIIVLALAIGIHSFYFFHRIIGPLYRFQRIFDEVGRGDLSMRVGIRKRDYLHDEEMAINEMIRGLADKLAAIHGAGMQATASLGELERVTARPGVGQARQYKDFLVSHRRHIDTMMHAVNQFKLQERKNNEMDAEAYERKT